MEGLASFPMQSLFSLTIPDVLRATDGGESAAAGGAIVAPAEAPPTPEEASFGEVLKQFESEQHRADADATLEGTVISVSDESVVLDIGRKIEGVLRREGAHLPADLKPGMTLSVSVVGRTDEGYYSLATMKVFRPVDLTGLKTALETKAIISGRVSEAVKGGLRVDIGVPAFMPASRSGVRAVADLEKLLGQDIQVRVTKIDDSNPERPDVVVDRRAVLEDEAARAKQESFGRLTEGMVIPVVVRSLTEFGAFCEIAPGVDGLLHVTDMSWQRVDKPDNVVQPGQALQVKVLKVNPATRKISLGLKQLEPDPWTAAAEQLKPGERIQGKVVRLADFGAFVEIAPGVDGLIHLSEMSWTKRIKHPADVLKTGDMVEAVVLEVKPADKRISLGLKQALGNPWDDIGTKFPVHSIVEGPVKSLAQFGAFVDLGEGIDGMIHIGDISREKRLNHPNEVLTVGQVVKAQVLEIDKSKKRIRLGMKQIEPTSADIFIGEHMVGEDVTGRVVEVRKDDAKVELAEGVHARCRFPKPASAAPETKVSGNVDDFAAVLTQKWKMGGGPSESGAPVKTGQIRKFRISAIEPGAKRIDVELID